MGDTGKISDGYHTFDELYDHRCHLFIALMQSHPEISWRARKHQDGSSYPDWFIAGMHLPDGDITYHLPAWMWSMLDGVYGESFKVIAPLEFAPPWDGHTSADVVKRLASWIQMRRADEY